MRTRIEYPELTAALAADPMGPQELLWTELRLPEDLRISRANDPLGELGEASALLTDPPQPNPSAGGLSALTESRTRLATYSCTAP